MKLLVIEDEARIAHDISAALASEGHHVDVARDGLVGDRIVQGAPPDAIILDLGLPRVDGLSLIRKWRDAGYTMPILILSARTNWRDRVEGINAGADDYMTKPFYVEELAARLRGLLRRDRKVEPRREVTTALVVDTFQRSASVDGRDVSLTSMEYRALTYLLDRRGEPVPKDELGRFLHERDRDLKSNAVEVLIVRLRRKLGPGIIETLHGHGYRIATRPPEEGEEAVSGS